ncbi:VG15 protein [Dermabacter hominis]|uniref:VG15 protein n=1 Tax=Dermabacter hominis TaxID=36740 RepID=UPI0021A8E04A|nr:hypothetical protein [Dermabacter hominis]MCT1790635.1 hypothetical protein [Dermabacter hominis]
MVSVRQARDFERAQRELSRLIERDIRRTWDALDAYTVEGKRDALLDLIPGLVNHYGDVAATIAAEYFEQCVGEAATIPAFAFDDAIAGSVRYGMGPAFAGRGDDALGLVVSASQRHMLQFGRSTMYESACAHDGVYFARVPDPNACAFCRMLAARGAAYTSKRSATAVTTGAREGESFHDDCHCSVAAARDDSELPYSPDKYYAEYAAARDASPESLVPRDGLSSEAYEARVKALKGDSQQAIAARMRAMSGMK